MPITNLQNQHLTAAQVTAIKTAITALENALTPVNVNLSAEERQQYGSINEQNKLFVNKVMDFHRQHSNFVVSP